VRVQVVQGERDLGGVELCDGVGEALGLAQQTKQLPALDKVHDHVQVLGVLEGAPQRDQERVLDLLQHAPLVVGVLDLLHLDHLRLLEHLDGVEARVVLGLDEVHAPEAAGAERALDGEVGQRVLALGGAGLVERLRLELHDAILGGRGVRAGRVGGVYQVLYAGHVVRRWVRGLRARILLRRLRVGGAHRVGFGGRGPSVVAAIIASVVAGRRRERLVRLRLMEVEGARFARGRRRDGRGAVSDGRRRQVEVFRAVRVLRPLLLEEAQGRHWRRGREECGGPAVLFRSQQQQGMRGAIKRGMRLTIERPTVNARGSVAIECVFAAWARRAVGWLVRGGWRRFGNDVRLAGKQQQVASESAVFHYGSDMFAFVNGLDSIQQQHMYVQIHAASCVIPAFRKPESAMQPVYTREDVIERKSTQNSFFKRKERLKPQGRGSQQFQRSILVKVAHST
jgi:hypothetical protein